MPRKKKQPKNPFEVTSRGEILNNDNATTTFPENINPVWEQSIAPLALNLDLGRQDLIDNFRMIQEKLNEIIKKVK